MGVDIDTCSVLDRFKNSTRLSFEELESLVQVLDSSVICCGHPDENFCNFVRSKKGQLTGRNNHVVAVLDSSVSIKVDKIHHETIRSPYCQLLSQARAKKCSTCRSSRVLIRSAYNRWNKPKSPSATSAKSKVKISSLTTPLCNKRINSLRQQVKSDSRCIKALKAKLDHISKTKGIVVDEELQTELASVLKDNTSTIRSLYPKESFHHILWEQQLEISQLANKRNIRWHPAIIRWCLYLKSISSSAYKAMQSSGFLTLPSDRTLRDYTHYTKSGIGFLPEVNNELMEQAKVNEVEDYKKCVGLLIDEVKIKDSLVFDKIHGKVIGWVNIGDFNNEIESLEKEATSETSLDSSLATHMLVFMVRGICTKLEFPLAQFLTKSLKGFQIYTLAWDAVRNIESAGLHVKYITADGASQNRLFFKLCRNHGDRSKVVYKTLNPYRAKESYIYLISDIPHLIKTSRNCFSHSFFGSNSRQLWVSQYLNGSK